MNTYVLSYMLFNMIKSYPLKKFKFLTSVTSLKTREQDKNFYPLS